MDIFVFKLRQQELLYLTVTNHLISSFISAHYFVLWSAKVHENVIGHIDFRGVWRRGLAEGL